MADPVEMFIGWTGLAGAIVLGYSAFKNKPAFGPNGIVTQAVTTGQISSAKSVPTNVPKNELTPGSDGKIDTGPYAGSTVAITPGTPAGTYTTAQQAQTARTNYAQSLTSRANAPSPSSAPSAPSSPLGGILGSIFDPGLGSLTSLPGGDWLYKHSGGSIVSKLTGGLL